MLPHLLEIAMMVVLTTLIHSVFTSVLLGAVDHRRQQIERRLQSWQRHLLIPIFVLMMIVAGICEAAAWAHYYVAIGAITQFTDALYFSLVTLTTLGYGDITLSEPGRVASGVEAAVGIVLFGWTTALIFKAVETVYARRPPMKRQDQA